MIGSTKFKKHRGYLDVLLVLLIFTAALMVRAFWIEHPALWSDEIFTVVYARQNFMDLLSLTRTTDIHPPLYYIAVKAVATIFGEGDGTQLRLLSASTSALTACVLFLFARHKFGLRVAIVATIFFIFLPVSVHYGRELRTYSTLALALLCATVSFVGLVEIRAESARKKLFALGYVASMVAAFHLHYSAIVYFFLFFLAALGLWALDGNYKGVRAALGATIVAGLLCVPQSIHFIAARRVVGEDFWIEPTNLRLFYSVSLGSYPFPSWGKLIVYPVYIVGAWLFWRKDRRLAVIVLTVLVGGPLTVALIGVWTPAYLVRTIQAFAVLSPLLLALLLNALPRPLFIPAITLLIVVHALTLERYYPNQKQELAIDMVEPLVAEVEPETVYFFAALQSQIELRQLHVDSWIPVELNDLSALESIDLQLQLCNEQSSCGPTVIVIERSPRFQIENGRSWMTGMDSLTGKYETISDVDVAGLRILALQ